METQLLTKTVVAAAEYLGYQTIVGDISPTTNLIQTLPAVCVARPVMRHKKGRNQGSVTYRIECAIVQSANPLEQVADNADTIDADAQQLQNLYNHALAIIDAVDSLDEVCQVECISSLPSRNRVTPYGDVTLKVVFDVTLKFRK